MPNFIRCAIFAFLLGCPAGVLGFTNPLVPPVQKYATQVQADIGNTHAARKNSVMMAVPAPQRYTSQDWAKNLVSIPKSVVLQNVQSHVLWNTAWAAVITFLYNIGDLQALTPLPHQLMATALGLLLVFRTNAAYDRFWEARKVWGAVVNTSRDNVRVALIAIDDPALRERYCQLGMLWPFLLKQHLQCDPDVDEVAAFSTLSREELESLCNDANPPLRVAQRMGEVLALNFQDRDDIMAFQYRTYLEGEITKFIDFMGMCERIKLTPVPLSYSRHTSRFLTVYMATLPFVLTSVCGNLTPYIIFCMCWGLFSIEEIGHYIEEPFDKSNAQLPLAGISGNIQKALQALVDAADPSTSPEQMTMEALRAEVASRVKA
uniref:Uncharacterized protein n=1 Tax=Fibrocapsa japonica TaxID=94617 RepID=A0A7S2V4G3_9STRA|mmetsp:Transcript_3852/g.5723  ORF Transcript_3852/g.5723 Transcript_3852/m.5723 type:complete len:376 (+) Transcript_3852:128-1255(+)